MHIWSRFQPVHARLVVSVNFVQAILSKFHAWEKLPSMHVQFFPVYVLTCGAQNSKPLLSFDLRIDSYESPDSLLTAYDLYE